MRIFTHFSRCGTPAALLRLRRARERGRLYFSLMNRASGQVDARRILSVAGAAAHPCRLKGGIPWHDARNPLRLLRRRSPSSLSDAAAHALARRTRAAVAWQSARSTARSSSPASAQKVGALSGNGVAQISMPILGGAAARRHAIHSVSSITNALGGWAACGRVGASVRLRKQPTPKRLTQGLIRLDGEAMMSEVECVPQSLAPSGYLRATQGISRQRMDARGCRCSQPVGHCLNKCMPTPCKERRHAIFRIRRLAASLSPCPSHMQHHHSRIAQHRLRRCVVLQSDRIRRLLDTTGHQTLWQVRH